MSRLELVRNIFVETAALMLTFILARLVGERVTAFVQVESCWWLLALLSALLVGAAAGLAVQKMLGRWVKG